MPVTIYHNPRCSKSKETLQLLQDREVEFEVVEYLETPPDLDQLTRILDLLGMEPRELMRTNETAYADNKLDDERLSRESLIAAMVENPVLIQRPIVIAGNKARIGRPPECVLEIV